MTSIHRGRAGESVPSFDDLTGRIELESSRIARRTMILAWLGLALIAALIITATLVRSPKTVLMLEENETIEEPAPAPTVGAAVLPEPSAAPRAPPSEIALADELDAARIAGVTALGALAQKYPSDKAVLKALLMANASDRAGYANAISLAKRLFELDPNTTIDDDLRKAMLRIVNGPTEIASVALDALGTKMGPSGPDLLYEVATEPSMGRFPRDRAGKLLETAEVKKLVSPALLIAMDLRTQGPCKRKELFARAESDGDGRALPYLKPLQTTTGCSKMLVMRGDCFPCLGNRVALNKAVKAIEARSATR